MSSNTLLSVSGQLLRRNALPLTKNAVGSTRKCHVACVPPRNKISMSETIVHGIIYTFAVLGTPAWIMYHLPDYQKEERNTYTGK